MSRYNSRLFIVACLTLLLIVPEATCQIANPTAIDASNVPASWLQPIGGGGAATTTPGASTSTTGSSDSLTASAATGSTTTGAAVGAGIGAAVGAGTGAAVGAGVATTTPNPVATTTTPGAGVGAAGATTTTSVPTPTATTTPAAGTATTTPTPTATTTTTPAMDPNAVAAGSTTTTPAATTTTTTTPAMDPNAVAIGSTTPTTTTTTDPMAGTTTTGMTDPTGMGIGAVAAAPVGAQVGPQVTTAAPPAEQVNPSPSPDPEANQPSPSPDNLPPGPPLDWQTLPLDTAIIFGIELQGPSLVPWTKTKSWVFNNVLQSRYLRSCDIKDIETGPLQTYTTAAPSPPPVGTGNRRLLQGEDPSTAAADMITGVFLRVTVRTNTIRVESEVRSVADGVSSGSLANDLTMSLGTPVNNVTMTQQPTTVPYDKLPDPNASSGGSLPGWIIGTIVGAILVLMPIPAYFLYKRHKKKHLEALEKQQAEAAAARQRMQSRIIKSSGKSFTGGRKGSNGSVGDPHDIYARSESNLIVNSMDMSRANSVTGLNGGMPRSGSFVMGQAPLSPERAYQQQQQLLYQQQSLGRGAMPRMPSFSASHRQYSNVAIHPVRYSDEGSSSSGNASEPGRH